MAGRSIPKAAAVITVLLMLGILIFISFSASAVGPYGIVEIEEDTYSIDVSPEDTGSVDIKISVRSTETRNTVFNIEWELDGPSTWAVDIPSKIYLGPLEKKSFTAAVICPIGEIADVSAELEISAVPEGNGIQVDAEVSSDTCTIMVNPFYRASVILENDYELQIPVGNTYGIKVQNDGNFRAPVGFKFMNSSILMGPFLEIVDPGENTTFFIDLEQVMEEGGMELELIALAGDRVSGEGTTIEIIREGSWLHLLFKPGPFLIMTGITIEGRTTDLNLFCIGGEIDNIGLEIVDGPSGATLFSEGGVNLDNLDRIIIDYDIGGVTESQFIIIQGYGYSNSRRITSNRIPIWVTGVRSETSSISVPAVVGGGAAALTVVVTGSAAYFYSASEVFKYRWLTLALVPLYSLVHEEKVLDHFFRGRLFEYIKENPGVTFTALKEHFEVNNGTLTYHLHRLEREELITYRNLGKYKLFYADGVKIKGVEVVISPLDKEIVEIISSQPGITSSEVIGMLRGERSQRTISRHLKQLERKGFIEVERAHGSRRLFLSGALERVLMPHRGVVEVSEVTAVEA
jgi:predicted transcriptional regulator